MRSWKKAVQIMAVLFVISLTNGCAFFGASGGGPLSRTQLGDWAGIKDEGAPQPEALMAVVQTIEGYSMNPFAGEIHLKKDGWGSSLNYGDPREIPFTPTRGLHIKGKFNPWLRLIPSKRHGDWLYYKPQSSDRRFYASEGEWGSGMLFADFLLAGDKANAYDIATRQRVAARKTNIALFLIGYTRVRRIAPVGPDGKPGLLAVSDPGVGLDTVKYDYKDGTAVLMGIIGWGRVNHRRYFQFLWIPIPMGAVKSY